MSRKYLDKHQIREILQDLDDMEVDSEELTTKIPKIKTTCCMMKRILTLVMNKMLMNMKIMIIS